MQVSVVVPNWNGRNLLPSLLGGLAAQTLPPAEVILVDNGSTDDSIEIASGLGARVISLPGNLGFAAAVNRGVAAAQSEFVAVLNNDVTLGTDWLRTISSAMKNGNTMFTTGKLLSAASPGIIDGTFDALCRGGLAWRCGHGRPDGPLWSVSRRISFPPFTAILLRRSQFLSMDGLDETYGSYLEDVDFGLRCASNGYTGCYVPEAIALHAGSATWGRWDSRTVRHVARNQMLILARHYPTALLWRYGWPIAIAHTLWGLVALRHGAGLAWFAGKIDGLRLWASVRRHDARDIAAVLGSGELLIQDLQRKTGYDWFWRLYFALT